MEGEYIIEDISWVEQRMIESRTIAEELSSHEPVVFEDEYITL
jgi:hypothetical protein